MQLKNGFTLMELMIVITIIGILAVISVPNIIGQLPEYRIKSASKEIASQLLLARMKAISRNCQYRIAFTTTGSYTVMRNDLVTGWVQDGDTTNLPDNVVFNNEGADPITFTNDQVTFKPSGAIDGISGGVYLKSSKGTRYRVTVLATTGRVKLEIYRPEKDVWDQV